MDLCPITDLQPRFSCLQSHSPNPKQITQPGPCPIESIIISTGVMFSRDVYHRKLTPNSNVKIHILHEAWPSSRVECRD